MKLFALRIAMRLFSWITPRAAETVVPALAALLWYVSPRKRRVTRLNLRAVYPELGEDEIRRIGRDAMTHYVRGIFEAGMLWHWPLDRIFGCFEEPAGQQAVLEAFQQGKGLILAAPHCGAWELLNLYLTRYRMATVLYKPGRHPEIDAALLEKRRRCGAQMAPANAVGLRMMYKTLKGGQAVGRQGGGAEQRQLRLARAVGAGTQGEGGHRRPRRLLLEPQAQQGEQQQQMSEAELAELRAEQEQE